MIDFKAPIFQLPKQQEEKRTREVWDACVRDGYEARRAGLKVHQCPAFRDSDMTASWMMGWHRSNNEMRRKR